MAIVKKISELTPKGSALANTDLLIVGVDNGTDYDLKSITGAQVLGNVVSQSITNGDTTHSPSSDVVFDALANKVDTVVGSRLITSAEATILGNTSGTNSGDQIISDETISLTDITTNNFSTTKHGFVPKGTNSGKYLKDDGTWSDLTLLTAQTSSTAIKFDKRYVHCNTGAGGVLTGLTGNVTVSTSLTAYIGTTSYLIHNDTSIPTFSSEFIKSQDSLDYKINVDNYIICTLINQNPFKVSYRIVRDVNDARLITSAEATILANTSGINTGDQDLSGLMVKSNNLSDLTNTTTARTNLGLGSLATQSGTFSGTSSGTNTGDQTFLNARVQSVTSSATVTPVSTNDLVIITAQAVGLTLANPTGTFTEGQALMIRIKDNGTARTIAFDTNYRAIGVTLPTTTVISKTMYLGIIYNSTDSKWDIIGYNIQA